MHPSIVVIDAARSPMATGHGAGVSRCSDECLKEAPMRVSHDDHFKLTEWGFKQPGPGWAEGLSKVLDVLTSSELLPARRTRPPDEASSLDGW